MADVARRPTVRFSFTLMEREMPTGRKSIGQNERYFKCSSKAVASVR